ncbi:MAG: hypothetical protein Q9225_008126, partial [Loekoesia sp. 1 TL-2023]
TGDEGRPIKRRRVRGQIITQEEAGSDQAESSADIPKLSVRQQSFPEEDQYQAPTDDDFKVPKPTAADHLSLQEQTAYVDETSEESDFAWEEVELAQEVDQPTLQPADEDEQGLDLVLEGDGKQDQKGTAAVRRRPLNAVERKLRLDVHKVHLLCLSSHIYLRNHWCNDQNVHVCNQSINFFACRLRDSSESVVPPATQGHCLPP